MGIGVGDQCGDCSDVDLGWIDVQVVVVGVLGQLFGQVFQGQFVVVVGGQFEVGQQY